LNATIGWVGSAAASVAELLLMELVHAFYSLALYARDHHTTK